MSQERRGAHRQRATLKTCLYSGSGRRTALILDLSQRGCFVLTPLEFLVGAPVKVEFGKPGLLHMTLEGAVVRHSAGRGVGISFSDLTVTQQALLSKLLRSLARPLG
jgi:hypothetical protein